MLTAALVTVGSRVTGDSVLTETSVVGGDFGLPGVSVLSVEVVRDIEVPEDCVASVVTKDSGVSGVSVLTVVL